MTKERAINYIIKEDKSIDTNLISDGYHTFGELYDHRIRLWISYLKLLAYSLRLTRYLPESSSGLVDWENEFPWRTIKHSDGEIAFGGGWFALGVGRDHGKQITYHLPMKYWEECDFANTIERAPDFDGHSSQDVLDRLRL